MREYLSLVEHLQAGLAGTAGAPGREDDEVRVLAVAVVTHADDEVVAEARGEIVEVARLCGGEERGIREQRRKRLILRKRLADLLCRNAPAGNEDAR